MQTILITGATGFLGSKITELFLADGCRVIILVHKRSSLKKLNTLNNHPRLFKVFLGEDDLRKCFSKYNIEAIVHTATCYGRNNEPWYEIAKVNLLLPLNLLVLGEQFGVKCFINADTFFNDKMKFASNESFYVKTKKNLLEIVRDATRQIKVKFINMRIEHMYGPDDGHEKFIPYIIKELLSNIKSIPFTKGEQKRDYVFINDVAEAFLQTFKNYPTLKTYEEFGIGFGRSISIKEVAEYLKKITGSKSSLKFGELAYRENEVMDSEANLSNNKKINWRATIDWYEGLQKTVNFYCNLK